MNQLDIAHATQSSSRTERSLPGSQTKRAGPFTRFVNSPSLFASLLLVAGFPAVGWHRTDAVQRAPAIAGYSWAQHPNALHVVYPTKDCGCGAAPVARVQQALKNGLDVLVIAPTSSKSLDALGRSNFPPSRFALVTNVGSDIIKRFSRSDKPASVRIRNGRIVAQVEGGNLPEPFLQKEVK